MHIKYLVQVVVLLSFFSGVVAAEPVGRVESLQGDKKLFRQETASAPFYRSHIEQEAGIGHHFRTDAKSMASIRFFLGGNVGLGRDCEIEVVNERDAKILSQGNYWMKFDQQDPNNPIRIQTAGGVMGIRGTELVVKVAEDGTTELSLLEGRVAVDAANGDTLVAEPGMRVTFGGGRQLRYTLFKVEKLLEKVEEELGPEFLQLRQSLLETRQAISEARLEARTADAQRKTRLISWRTQHLGRGGGSQDLDTNVDLESPREKAQRLQEMLDRIDGRGQRPTKYEQDPEAERLRCGTFPSFEWPGAEDGKFAVLVLDPENDSNILWISETVGPSYTHPDDARPFAPGPYTLRVVPINEEGQFQEATDYPIQVEEPR